MEGASFFKSLKSSCDDSDIPNMYNMTTQVTGSEPHSPVKQRKLDDGFFVPQTPPLKPKESCPGSDGFSSFSASKSDSLFPNSDDCELNMKENLQDSTNETTNGITVRENEESTQSEYSTDINGASSEPKPCLEKNFKELKDMMEEAKHLQQEFCSTLMDSETYEMVELPSKIDKLLKSALLLEQERIEQKEKLLKRLHLLGQALHRE